MRSLFSKLDEISGTKGGKIINQLFPIITCFVLFIIFIVMTFLFITYGINPTTQEKIKIYLHPIDIIVGFFLYFITAIDYALIVGRMTITNKGAKARFIMNVFTCVGCFVGVSFVLFLWGFAKDIAWFIMPLLIFAGSVMIKLAYEGKEYFENDEKIPSIIRKITVITLSGLYSLTHIFTFWIPELGSPKVQKMSSFNLAKWAFFLPFIIGLDDLIGYMGAMTIYNAFGLIFGIYLADILIDILIFVSPDFTKKIVESSLLSLIASGAFLYLAYKSYSESFLLLHEEFHIEGTSIIIGIAVFIVLYGIIQFLLSRLRKNTTQKAL